MLLEPEDCTLPHHCRKCLLVHHSKFASQLAATGHSRRSRFERESACPPISDMSGGCQIRRDGPTTDMIASLMALQEHLVLPAAHAQQNLADQSNVMPVVGIDRDLGRRADRHVVSR